MNMQETSKIALLVVTDLMARSRLESAAKGAQMQPVVVSRLESTDQEPQIVVVDLDRAGAVEEIRVWREANPEVPIVGFVSHVDGQTRDEAVALGVRVVPRGATSGDASRIFARG